MNECCRDDDSSAELTKTNENDVIRSNRRKACRDDGDENADRRRNENDEQEPVHVSPDLWFLR